jgi:hypothetical protein
MLCMSTQYHTRNGRSGPGGAVSVGAHSAISLEYKRTMLSPESDEIPLRGPKHFYNQGQAPEFHVMYANPIPHSQLPLGPWWRGAARAAPWRRERGSTPCPSGPGGAARRKRRAVAP